MGTASAQDLEIGLWTSRGYQELFVSGTGSPLDSSRHASNEQQAKRAPLRC